jgi:tryptophan synthase alpha chain
MFNEIFKTHKKVLIPFLMAGVPSLTETEHLAEAMISGGAHILEIGVPFSDPGADGPILQKASEIALQQNVTLDEIFKCIKKIKAKHPHVAIVLFTYLNPILSYGLKSYVARAVTAGVNATLTVDLPIEEADEYRSVHIAGNLHTVFLASPTTSSARLEKIKEASTAFLYYVSRTGVTGLSAAAAYDIDKLRSGIDRPIAIGFGISSAEDVSKVSQDFDGVIIGSAYMRMIMEADDATSVVRTFTQKCSNHLNK